MKRQIGCAGSRLPRPPVRWQSPLFLADKPEIFAQWIRWMETIPITGKRVHDARLVAVLHNPLAPISTTSSSCMPSTSPLACPVAARMSRVSSQPARRRTRPYGLRTRLPLQLWWRVSRAKSQPKVDRLLPWAAVTLAKAPKTMPLIAEGADIQRRIRPAATRPTR